MVFTTFNILESSFTVSQQEMHEIKYQSKTFGYLKYNLFQNHILTILKQFFESINIITMYKIIIFLKRKNYDQQLSFYLPIVLFNVS